jgi:hypothetical protein
MYSHTHTHRLLHHVPENSKVYLYLKNVCACVLMSTYLYNYLSEPNSYLLYKLSTFVSLHIYLKLPLTHTFSPCIYICISTRALSLSLAVLMLYSCFTHALLMLYSCFSADGAQVNRSLLCAHHLDRRPQNRHALLTLYSCFT